MPTRTEAAEALHRAADKLRNYDGWLVADVGRPREFTEMWAAVRAALDAYSTSTPDPLPAEVQRVLEAACGYVDAPNNNGDVTPERYSALESAVAAYRSTQPEPLSARLARLRPGVKSVVDLSGGRRRYVAWNDPDKRKLLCFDGETSFVEWAAYATVEAILSESP